MRSPKSAGKPCIAGTNDGLNLKNTSSNYRQNVSWYDTEHYHSGIDYVTPQQAHQGLRQQIVDQRRIKKLSQRCRRREENEKQKSDMTQTNDQQNTATRLVA